MTNSTKAFEKLYPRIATKSIHVGGVGKLNQQNQFEFKKTKLKVPEPGKYTSLKFISVRFGDRKMDK